ncbi:MAG: preprotein translocase subunit SecE [Bacteroidetes bacterium]|nr:preprotein translocase subunit SecE [Bacteroidota bacterium]MBL7102780.1 preprotein translocase subunit SecE [Bacteroidales bacterium]
MAKFKIQSYVKESYDELVHKVSWPTWNELQNSAIVVSVASLIIAFIVYLMDFSFQNLLQLFYENF